MKQELFNPKRFIRLFSQTLASGLAIFFLNQFFGISIDDMQAVMFIALVVCILLIAYLAQKSSRLTKNGARGWKLQSKTLELQKRNSGALMNELRNVRKALTSHVRRTRETRRFVFALSIDEFGAIRWD
ncbi:hypothetical protein [Marinobacter sp.]|uniref:hypothetical protein n=1 Tax=Marinobacter sp. TaxID=50741 RepID=UPI0026250738|nr:hypothetical protein [Marinobacter sp.]